MKFDIAIARFPATGWERHELADWLVTTVGVMKQDERIRKVFRLNYPNDTPITMLRNRCIVEAKRLGVAYLLMVDSDMVPDLYPQAPKFWDTAWSFMMKRRKEEDSFRTAYPKLKEELGAYYAPATIAAPYCGPPPDELPYIFRFCNRESANPNPDWALKLIPREMAAIMGGIQKMDALATGLILYDMRVFDRLKPPWYRYEYSDVTESQKVSTEDVFQTRNAGLAGMPQYCAFDCWAGHAKGKIVGKPAIITVDRVAAAYREAVDRNVSSTDRLIVISDGHEAKHPAPEAAAEAPMVPAPAEEDAEQHFTDEHAFAMIDAGAWMTCDVYTFRNQRKFENGEILYYGEILYWGEYLDGNSRPEAAPLVVRSTPITLYDLKNIHKSIGHLPIWRRADTPVPVSEAEMAPEETERYFSDEEAFALMEKGVWMTCGGYTLRNMRELKDGEILYWQEYVGGDSRPGANSIGTSAPITLRELKKMNSEINPQPIWRRADPPALVSEAAMAADWNPPDEPEPSVEFKMAESAAIPGLFVSSDTPIPFLPGDPASDTPIPFLPGDPASDEVEAFPDHRDHL